MFFPDTVTLYPYSSKDFHHKVTYGVHSHPSCRYEKIIKVVKDVKGNDILTVAWVQFPASTVVNIDDKILLPDGTTGPVKVVYSGKLAVDVYLSEESM